MSEIKVSVVVDGYKCVEDVAKAVLNYTYKGKTLKEWADSISKPQTNADRIRAMTDEELARFIACQRGWYCDFKDPSEEEYPKAFEWLKQETSE